MRCPIMGLVSTNGTYFRVSTFFDGLFVAVASLARNMAAKIIWNLGHASCPPPYPQAGLRGAILYPRPPPPPQTGYEFCT